MFSSSILGATYLGRAKEDRAKQGRVNERSSNYMKVDYKMSIIKFVHLISGKWCVHFFSYSDDDLMLKWRVC